MKIALPGIAIAIALSSVLSSRATASDWIGCAFDVGQPAPAPYYRGLEGISGDRLRNELSRILNEGAVKLSYDAVWVALENVDEDPCNAKNVILLYTGRSQGKETRDQGGQGNDSWNREHVWPKSHGFPAPAQAAYTDIHHLRPADKTVNSSRGNKDFAVGGNAHHEAIGSRATPTTWEPRDEVKGDIARMILYMDVRYQGSGNVPDLVVVDRVTQSNRPQIGKLCTLLEWHRVDPVDDWERRRNNRIAVIQKNRNPFIDHPEYAEKIFRTQCPN